MSGDGGFGAAVRTEAILALDLLDALTGHRLPRVCCWIAEHPWWDAVSAEKAAEHLWLLHELGVYEDPEGS